MVGLRGRLGAWSKAAILLCLALAWPEDARGEDVLRNSTSRAAAKVGEKAEPQEGARVDSEASGSKSPDEPLRKVAGNMYMEVLARDLRLTSTNAQKLKHGDDIVALYENKGAATELRSVYRDALARGLKRKATIRAIREAIDTQITRGLYISKHLRSGAVDVRSWNMEGALEKALREAVKAEPGASLMDERDGAEPHFHLNLH